MAKAYIIKDANFNVSSKSYILTNSYYNKPENVEIFEFSGKTYIGGNPIYRPPTYTPFKVSFKSINIEGYSEFEIPPIGIAVVGFNNYIL